MSYSKFGTIEQEKDLVVPMSERYAFSRLMCNRKRFVLRMVFYNLYALITGFGIFLIYYFAQGPMNAKGQMYDVATYGVVGTVIVVYIHHVQVMIHVKNWTWWIVMWMIISIAFLPITCWVAQIGPWTSMHKAIFSKLLPALQLDAVILLLVVAFTVPMLLHKYIHELFLWPRFYTLE